MRPSPICILASSLSLLCGRAALARTEAVNLNFEEGNVGEVPPGWFVPTGGYHAELTANHPQEGKLCVHLSESGEGERAPFGNIMQSIRADEYRGKRVRLRAAIRADVSGTNRAQMWFRVDREDRKRGFFDNMGDRPITNSTWEYYEIVGDIAADAKYINFGLMLIKSGSVWFDDVALKVLGDVAQVKAEPPRLLEGRGLDNLVAFTRLLGYVRHFHPSDQAANTDWDEFAIAGIREIESAQSAEQLARSLGDIFRSVAPTLRVYPTGRKPEPPVELKLPSDANTLDVIAWRHRGFGQGGTRGTYKSTRLRRNISHGELPNGVPNPGEPFEVDLSGGVSCMVPIGLFADEEGTIPHTTNDEQGAADSALVEYTAADRATRLAGVALAWNIFQHFYPYFDVVETDWPTALRVALESAATDKDGDAFAKTLQRLVAALHDGHGGVGNPNASHGRPLPLLWDWIENQLVITYVTSGVDLKAGDVVLKIDGKPAADALGEIEELVSAATMQWRRRVGLRRLLATNRDHVELEVRSLDGRMRTLMVKPVVLQQPLRESRPETVAEIRPGIMYVDIVRLTDDGFRAALPRLQEAKGIVFDFRGYPRSIRPQTLFPHIIATPVTSAQWHVPIIRFPDRANVMFDRGGEWYITPKTPYLEAKKAFITDGRAISYAESCLGIIEHYKLGEIVGGPTAGTNGNVNPFALPGGYRVTWTGMRVLKHDGSQHHGVGIRPTVPVSRTIKGVAEGKDELLERAIEIVSR